MFVPKRVKSGAGKTPLGKNIGSRIRGKKVPVNPHRPQRTLGRNVGGKSLSGGRRKTAVERILLREGKEEEHFER